LAFNSADPGATAFRDAPLQGGDPVAASARDRVPHADEPDRHGPSAGNPPELPGGGQSPRDFGVAGGRPQRVLVADALPTMAVAARFLVRRERIVAM